MVTEDGNRSDIQQPVGEEVVSAVRNGGGPTRQSHGDQVGGGTHPGVGALTSLFFSIPWNQLLKFHFSPLKYLLTFLIITGDEGRSKKGMAFPRK